MLKPFVRALAASTLAALVGLGASARAGDDVAPPAPLTTSDPAVPVQELVLFLIPLTKSELLVQAEAWQGLVREKAQEIAEVEVAVKRQNAEIDKAEQIQQTAEKAKNELARVKERVKQAREQGDSSAVAKAQEAARQAEEKVREVSASVDEAAQAAERTARIESRMSDETKAELDDTVRAADAAGDAVERVQEHVADAADKDDAADISESADAAKVAAADAETASAEVTDRVDSVAEAVAASGLDDKDSALQQTAGAAEQAKEAKQADKVGLLEHLTELRGERTLLLDNLRTVVDALEAKTDPEDAETQAIIRDYRLYIGGVSGIKLDVTDVTSTWVSVRGWLMSEEGGIRWAMNLAKFFGIIIGAWILAGLVGGMMRRAMGRASLPKLLSDFLVKTVRWVVLLVGVVWALSALEVSITPLLALVGAAGFVIAFAMQDSLSNFASGLMILFFRPFDTGHVVDAGGVSGTVRSMNLVSTTIKTFDNKLMVVPNNKIWADVITNATDVSERRVDMEFGIGYDDDIDLALEILNEIVASHPKVLKDPAPTIKLNALADSSVNFICRPWAETSDYWAVYWDVTREVKRRFDAAGIGIPYPQQDVHLYLADPAARQHLLGAAAPGTAADETGTRDGGLDRADGQSD